MRDRLIELLCNVKCEGEECFGNCPYRIGQRCNKVQRLEMCSVFAIADALLAEGVIVPPCKAGDVVYCIMYDKARKPYVKPLEVHTITVWRNKTFSVFTSKEDIWNRSAFATKEEAERALAERREG